jgi:hypothetical protein
MASKCGWIEGGEIPLFEYNYFNHLRLHLLFQHRESTQAVQPGLTSRADIHLPYAYTSQIWPPVCTVSWSVVVYDTQTRSLLQTGQCFTSVSSRKKDLFVNPDTDVDVYFGPEPPVGKESNWIKTIPGKGWWTYLRLYGPLEPWFDKTWRPGEIELID